MVWDPAPDRPKSSPITASPIKQKNLQKFCVMMDPEKRINVAPTYPDTQHCRRALRKSSTKVYVHTEGPVDTVVRGLAGLPHLWRGQQVQPKDTQTSE